MAYVKLFESIIHSTVWQEPLETKVTWITMLAMADQHGVVSASIPGLAKAAGVTLEGCERALATFLAPDKYSRTPDFEGRRIEPVQGGWVLLNHAFYRDLRERDDRREAARIGMQALRARRKDVNEPVNPLTDVGKVNQASASASEDKKPSAPKPARETREEAFERFWAIYPNKKGKADALKTWLRLKLAPMADTIIADVQKRLRSDEQWTKDGGRFIPHGSTYVNGRGWEDGLGVEPAKPEPRQGPSPRKTREQERDSAREAKELLRANDPEMFRQLYQEEP